MSNDDYTHRWRWEERLLHPAIQHINCSPNIDNETLMALNRMAEIVYNMSTDEIKKLKQNKQ